MKNLFLKTFFLCISISMIYSCGDDDTPKIEDLPESYYSWDSNGETHNAVNTDRYAYSSGPNFVILGEAPVEGQMVIALNNSNGHPGATDKVFQMDEQSLDFLQFTDSDDNTWTSNNPGGSGTVNMTLYQTFDDATFTRAFVEGTFSGILTSRTDSTVYVVENGVFGVKEN